MYLRRDEPLYANSWEAFFEACDIHPSHKHGLKTSAQMATIKAIEGRSVHQIQSGQVIVDLNSVVKELVENSLDAGASSIEVRFKNQGLDSIEVQDNGKGISPDDFETVALKHYTSKLSSYEDLTSLDTFGFRGEALSSLCALSKFHIVTARAEDGAVGRKLDFEVSGKLKSNTVVAAQKGTTVIVEDLFCNLPVRRKELDKNIKREYGKVISLLHAYACISVGVRFSVTNHMPKGKKAAVFSTKSNTTTKENIVNVFGAKTLLALVTLDLHLAIEPSKGPSTQGARSWSTQATDRSMVVRVEGHISKPVFGEGRQAPDRQMFFVNSRPCLLPQVSKAINEVYKSFNVSQLPFIFANLIMDTNSYDVNVSPDKRSIMLHDQTALLESLKTALTELFERTDHTIPQSTLPNKKLPAYQPLTVPRRTSTGASTTPTVDEKEAEDDKEQSDASSAAADPTPVLRRRSVGPQPSLIENWAGRDTEQRKEKPVPRKQTAMLATDKRKLIETLQDDDDLDVERNEPTVNNTSHMRSPNLVQPKVARGDSEIPDASNDKVEALPSGVSVAGAEAPAPDPLSTPYDDLFSQRPQSASKPDQATGSPRQPQSGTFGLGDADEHPAATPKPSSAENPAVKQLLGQPQIPAVTPGSQKAAPGFVANAFDRMRPKRTPLQTAEITVGDTTTTTVIGSSPAYKRRRLHQPENSQTIAKFGASPLLARGLRNFAAPGSQMQIDSSNLPTPGNRPDTDDDDEDERGSASESESDVPGAEDTTALREQLLAHSDDRTSDPLDELLPAPADDDQYDEDYLDEAEKKIREDERVARLIQEAEEAAARPTENNLRRASQVLKNGGNRREATLQLMRVVNASVADIKRSARHTSNDAATGDARQGNAVVKDELDDSNAEKKLSLTVSKADFERMTIIGQFNLGFILAVRPASTESDEDELFIIDQHAADEKYNYERLQRTVTLQSQRLVRPKPLELTAVEEEIILNHSPALKANGFEIETTSTLTNDDPGTSGRRCHLLTLPISGEKTFDLSDLEELLHLLSEAPPTGSSSSADIPRPKKVQRMLAMRACRSSIMVGKTLTSRQMEKVVRHMGEMEKPWNCPHGRPTMRHLAGLGAWRGWMEGDVVDEEEEEGSDGGGKGTDWKAWLDGRK